MKRFLRFAAIIAGLGAAAWLVKDRLLPTPAPPVGPPPPFRAPPPEPTPSQPPPPSASTGGPDDLTRIKGIGPVYSDRLAASGISSFAALAAAEAAGLAAELDVREEQVASWIEQAKARDT
jgi:hypothetical protein